MIVMLLDTFETVWRLLLPEYMKVILENPVFVSAELTAIVLVMFLAFCIVGGNSAERFPHNHVNR